MKSVSCGVFVSFLGTCIIAHGEFDTNARPQLDIILTGSSTYLASDFVVNTSIRVPEQDHRPRAHTYSKKWQSNAAILTQRRSLFKKSSLLKALLLMSVVESQMRRLLPVVVVLATMIMESKKKHHLPVAVVLTRMESALSLSLWS